MLEHEENTGFPNTRRGIKSKIRFEISLSQKIFRWFNHLFSRKTSILVYRWYSISWAFSSIFSLIFFTLIYRSQNEFSGSNWWIWPETIFGGSTGSFPLNLLLGTSLSKNFFGDPLRGSKSRDYENFLRSQEDERPRWSLIVSMRKQHKSKCFLSIDHQWCSYELRR